jgi:putative zinc finger/helix-turn-helix YgiT family protein
MSKPKKCPDCGAAEMTVACEDYPYEESGLKGALLIGIEVRRCPQCGATEPLIQNIEGLHRALARGIVEHPARLSGQEVRFLRTYLGLRGVDFARVMGVTKECVSRWENDHEPIGGTADRALRLLVLTQKPVSDYAPDKLNALLESITDQQVKEEPFRLERRAGGWAPQAAA